MRLLTTAVLACGLVLRAPAPLAAFEYDEHCRLSNNALRIAIGAMSARHPQLDALRASPGLQATLRAESRCDKKAVSERSYGDLVSRVDWARAPGDFFLADLPRGEGDVTGTDVIPWNRIDALVSRRFQDFRALHENAEHFGGRALFYFDAWHNQAVSLAARGNLAGALVYNAFADHYLEDHFAPGHIYTPRTGLTDLITPNMHDYYNRRGAYYRAANTDLLADLVLAFRRQDTVPAHVLRLVRTVCGSPGWTPADTLLKPCLRSVTSDTLRLYGDALLHDAPAQELFVTLVIARSVADILESWLTRTPSEHFGEKRWCGYVPVNDDPEAVEWWRSPVAAIRYGTYRAEVDSGFPHFDHPWIVAGAVETIPSTGEVRTSLASEWFISGWAGSGWLGDDSEDLKSAFNTNESTYLGYEVHRVCSNDAGGCRGGAGAYLRFLFPVPRINTQISALGGVRASTPPADGRGPAVSVWVGLGPETGFSVFHLGGRVIAEVTAVQGRGPAVSVGFAPSFHLAVPRRYFFPPRTRYRIPAPPSLEEAASCQGSEGSGQGLWISPTP